MMKNINGEILACEKCTRGHRVSKCFHSNRKLNIIDPKGRPSSQCTVCKIKRKENSFHGKCACANVHLSMRKRRGKESSSSSTSCDCDTTGFCNCCSLPSGSTTTTTITNNTTIPQQIDSSIISDQSNEKINTTSTHSNNDGPFLIPSSDQDDRVQSDQKEDLKTVDRSNNKVGGGIDNSSKEENCLFSKDVSKFTSLDESHSSNCCQSSSIGILSTTLTLIKNDQKNNNDNSPRCESCYVCLFGSNCPPPK